MPPRQKATSDDDKATATARNVTRSATIPVTDITIDDIIAGAAEVGAPNTARISTGGAPYNPDGNNEYQHSVTYSWSETI